MGVLAAPAPPKHPKKLFPAPLGERGQGVRGTERNFEKAIETYDRTLVLIAIPCYTLSTKLSDNLTTFRLGIIRFYSFFSRNES